MFMNVATAQDTIWFECHVMRQCLPHAEEPMDVGNRDRLSEGHFLFSHCCLFRGAFGGLPMAVSPALGIEELDPVDVDELPAMPSICAFSSGMRLWLLPGSTKLVFNTGDSLAQLANFALGSHLSS